MDIINLTQHPGAPEQGVIEPENKDDVKELLTFEMLPSQEEMADRAQKLASIAVAAEVDAAMIGGAPYFMRPLEEALEEAEVRPVYAFSRRESVEETDPETGEVRKNVVFRHLGFVGISGAEQE